eukprot:TRINITY_DN274_c0_g1_i3.p1 TRINITY_DN274_c0_g1~~TRINITY_DN274_c0_g1_i3.p1  ORF type:complete len:418 (+),score=83.47 TRINITY_DN274_c0_g1_i3:71-1324(+)
MLVSIRKISKSAALSSRYFSSNNMQNQDVVIVAATRTPIGSIGGSLASLTGPQLGSIAVKGALEKIKLDPNQVNEVIMGNVLSANIGQAPARQVCIGAGLPKSVVCTTVNKVCASGLKAVTIAAQTIALGHADVIVAGGFESMSNVPFYLEKARYGYKYGNSQIFDGIQKDGLTDVYNKFAMGNCAEDTARKFNISREEQDRHAIESYRRAQEATKSGAFKGEVIPVQVSNRKGEMTTVTDDEEPMTVKFDRVPTLKPVFDPKGSVTAANSSTLNDGASAVILMSRSKAKELGIKPIALIRGFADAEQDPIDFPTTPAKAIPLALKRANISPNSVDFYEINQAFSVVSLANQKLLNLDPAKVDVRGGGVAIGHPIGSSGARILTTLIHLLHDKNGKIGVAAICNGGGGATSIVVEKL